MKATLTAQYFPNPAEQLAVATNLETLIPPLVSNALSSEHSRRAYGRALRAFFAWYGDGSAVGFSRPTVQAYRAHLEAAGFSSSTINQSLAAIRKLAQEAMDAGLLAPDIATGVMRLPGIRKHGVRAGNWLTRREAADLLAAPDTATLKGKRDRVILGLLLGCGLRRQEVASLTLEHIQERDERPVIVDMVGKGGRVRTVPMPRWVREDIRMWVEAAEVTGRLLRGIHKGDRLSGEGLSACRIWAVVRTLTSGPMTSGGLLRN
jgi:site-specific recombinase XerD